MLDHSHPPTIWQDPPSYSNVFRKNLVQGLLDLVINKKVIVIRSTPATGKSKALLQLGDYILKSPKHDMLEPVLITWDKDPKKHYRTYLDEKAEEFVKINEQHRTTQEKQHRTPQEGQRQPPKKGRRNIFLIDEAQNTYEEKDMWSRLFKNPLDLDHELYVLVCVYGSSQGIFRFGKALSESALINLERRIELRPTAANKLSMLFTQGELEEVIQTWAGANRLELHLDVYQYLMSETEGHPGVLGSILYYLASVIPKQPPFSKKPTLDVKLCSDFLHKTDCMNHLQITTRVLWNTQSISWVNDKLNSERANLKTTLQISDITTALKKVAKERTRYVCESTGLDREALSFCHQAGFVFTDPVDPLETPTGLNGFHIRQTYSFPSPTHKRLVYWKLFPGPALDAPPDTRTLLEVVHQTLKQFRPSAMQSRDAQFNRPWKISEPKFQNEMYHCLTETIDGLPVEPEFTNDTQEGRIDLWIPSRKWGIELLQNGTVENILDHVARFNGIGKYRKWGILEDFIIINFCPESHVRDLRDTGKCYLEGPISQLIETNDIQI
ncbi:MAG: hypothetical protein Q9187_003203 [Circinaria calcarea]